MIDVAIKQKLGRFELDVRFDSIGPVTALFGPSGSGKSSVVKAIAGLSQPGSGHIRVGDTVLHDSASRINLSAMKRRAGVVFQDGRLFPHLNVKANLLYGYSRAKGEKKITPEQVIGILGIGNLLDRSPQNLSGGERQRVALGRALLMQPRLLLMDEPLASLDAERKAEVLPYFGLLAQSFDIPILYVTHDVTEVFELAHHLVLIRDGRVTVSGTVEDITGRLDLPAGAEAFGHGVVVEGLIVGHDEVRALTFIDCRVGRFAVPMCAVAAGSRVTLRVAGKDVALATSAPESISIQNIFEGHVTDMHRTGAFTTRLSLDVSGGRLLSEVTNDSVQRLNLAKGVRVHALVKAVALVRSTRATRPD